MNGVNENSHHPADERSEQGNRSDRDRIVTRNTRPGRRSRNEMRQRHKHDPYYITVVHVDVK